MSEEYIQIGTETKSNRMFISVPAKDGRELTAPLSKQKNTAIVFDKKHLVWMISDLITYLEPDDIPEIENALEMYCSHEVINNGDGVCIKCGEQT